MTTADVRSTVDWEVLALANLKPDSLFKSNSPSLFSEVSYPRPWREFKLLKREVVYNFDVMTFKRRCLERKKKILQISILRLIIVAVNDIRAVGL